ncbi:unnamed protein product, partial [Adineta ricciae]
MQSTSSEQLAASSDGEGRNEGTSALNALQVLSESINDVYTQIIMARSVPAGTCRSLLESRRAVPEPTQISTDPVAGMIGLGNSQSEAVPLDDPKYWAIY